MEIINYSSEYSKQVKDLLVEIQEYIVSIDKEKYNILTETYREMYFNKTINEVKKCAGKILLAKENDKIVGLIAGIVNNEAESTYDFNAPKRGRITELIISREYRYNGIGKKLLVEMEKYLKQIGCEGVLIDVFGYNKNAQRFYYKNGYFDRNIEVMKKF